MKTNREPTPAQLAFAKPRALKECSPNNRTIDTGTYFPVVVNFDVTDNGMCDLPQIFWDDLPEFVENGRRMVPAFFENMPTFYFGGVGDIKYDSAPIQVTTSASFSVNGIREKLTKLWLEKGGGGGTEIENLCESYEMMAYFLAKRFRLWDNAPHPTYQTCIFVADEAPRLTLEKSELDWWLGGTNTATDATAVFAELKRKFKGNVFLIYRPTFGGKEGKAILTAWRTLLGDDKILVLPSDRLITAAIRELITVVAANHTVADAQKRLNELAPKVVAREPAAEPFTATPNTAPALKKPRSAQPSDVWRLDPKVTERPARSTARKPKTSNDFRL
jgi:hypothetical protein